MANVTAKIKVDSKSAPQYHDQQTITFSPDYNDGRNKEWAEATPSLSLSITVKGSVAEHFEVGQAFTLTFTPEDSSE